MEDRPTKQIHHTNLLKKALRIESTIQIFKVRIRESGFTSPPAWICKGSFRAIVLRISEDSWEQVESLEVQVTNQIHNLNLEELDSQIRISKSVKSDLSITKHNKSFWSQDSWLRYETNPRFYESHTIPVTLLFYDLVIDVITSLMWSDRPLFL